MVRKPFLSNHYLVKDYIKSMVVEEGHSTKQNKQANKETWLSAYNLFAGWLF